MAIDKRTKKLENKIKQKVFDNRTVAVLHKLFTKGYLDKLGGPIAVGKEANVHYGYQNGQLRAVKIFRVETSSFKNMMPYLEGDPRFNVRKEKYSIVEVWAKKEYQNLKRAFKAGVSCPEPIGVHKHVIVMEFIGNTSPAPELRVSIPENINLVYKKTLESLNNLYNSAKLVHGDMSEYNILLNNEEPVLIDFGQAMIRDHPIAPELLNRDCGVLARFFKKQGVETSAEIIKEKILEV